MKKYNLRRCLRMKTVNVEGTEVKLEIKEEKKGLKSWIYKHRIGIMRTVTVVGGLVTLDLTYRKGVKDGLDMAKEKVVDIIDNVAEEIVPDYVVEED